MIESIRFENYRSLRDVTLQLSPLTVLVGPNGAGKSNVFRALLGDMSGAVAWRGSGAARVHLQPGNRTLEGGAWIGEAPSVARLRLDPNALRRQVQAAHAPLLEESGGNLPQVVDSLGRKGMEAFAAEFCRLIPVFSDVDVLPGHSGTQRLVFQDRWNHGVQYGAGDVSDGTMYVAAFLAVARQIHRPEVLCIEEPERGLHPWLMQEVVKVLRALVKPDAGRLGVQIIMATQSAELLDCVEPTEVRLVDRSPDDGSTSIRGIDTRQAGWEDAYRTFRQSLGAMWLSGGLGGVPGR